MKNVIPITDFAAGGRAREMRSTSTRDCAARRAGMFLGAEPGERAYKLQHYAEVLRQMHSAMPRLSCAVVDYPADVDAALAEAADELEARAAELLGSLL